MNLNELAKEISILEGGARNLNIADIKEVLKCLSVVMYETCNMDTQLMNLAMKLWKNGKKHVTKKKVKKK
jgi:hypothetical protein